LTNQVETHNLNMDKKQN